MTTHTDHLAIDELVEEAGNESFPASDAPCWVGTHAGAPAKQMPALRTLRETRDELEAHVRRLAEIIGERNDRAPEPLMALRCAADYVSTKLLDAGFSVTRYPIVGSPGAENVEARLGGFLTPEESIVVGAHYDSIPGGPGADDNASGVAVMLAVARSLAGARFRRSVRLVAFANEEPPHTRRNTMGSLQYANMLQGEEVHVSAMISLETLGFYSRRRSDPEYPWPLNLVSPWRGDFLAIVGNLASARVVRRAHEAFCRTVEDVRVKAFAFPGFLPLVKSSDHWSFWKCGFPAIMLTDTGPLRSRRYHRATDTPEPLDFERLAHMVPGVAAIVSELAH